MTINYDQFAVSRANSRRFNEAGGITFAHELGHYLGLMHTHEGECSGEGEGPNLADAVPDTPFNKNIASSASPKMLSELAAWCTSFRKGKGPDPKSLLQFNSCGEPGGVDNVFNVLSYLPDECCMLLTDNQIARMQWVVAKYRPKMMAKYATQ